MPRLQKGNMPVPRDIQTFHVTGTGVPISKPIVSVEVESA
jgi:hypothetical protein